MCLRLSNVEHAAQTDDHFVSPAKAGVQEELLEGMAPLDSSLRWNDGRWGLVPLIPTFSRQGRRGMETPSACEFASLFQ